MQPIDFTDADIKKLVIAGFAYFVVAPILGSVAATNRWLQRTLVLALVLIPSLYFIETSLMIMSIEWYRGHTKGFLFSSMDIIAIALIVSALVSRRPRFSLAPPGSIPYLLFCALCTISIINAERQIFTIMALVKFLKAFLVYVAAYNFLRNRKDLRTLLVSCSIALVVQAMIVVKMRYVDGVHQGFGMMAHQNSLSMWAYFLGLPLFAVALSRKSGRVESLFYLAGTSGAGVIVILSLSRAALAIFAVGAIAILGIAMLNKVTLKRATIVTLGAAAAFLVLFKASDNIVDRWSSSKDYDKSGDLRWILNRMSEQMLKDTKIGVGWNNFNIVNSRPFMRYSRMKEEWDRRRGFYANTAFYKRNPNTESLYWMYLAETGYPGFIGLILWLGSWFLIAARGWLARGDTLIGAFLFGLTITLMVYFAHHSYERILTQTINLAAFMVFLGVAARAHTEHKASGEKGRLPPIGLVYRVASFLSGSRKPAIAR